MWHSIGVFLCDNWLNLLLVLVTGSALLIYWLQERRKISEAASLIVMQVDDLQKRMRQIKTFISEDQLNGTAFYESQILFKTDYWDKYKHYFVRKLDSESFNTFNEFYSCALEVMEQQELMKNLQKNDFFVNQQTLTNVEANLILQTISAVSHSPVDSQKMVDGIMEVCPADMSLEQREAIGGMLKRIYSTNGTPDFNAFWSMYNKDKQIVIDAFNKEAFTRYVPVQIKISLQKALGQFDSIPVIGCTGYDKLKKLAERKI